MLLLNLDAFQYPMAVSWSPWSMIVHSDPSAATSAQPLAPTRSARHSPPSALASALQAVHVASPEGPERAGLDAALIASFPCYPYKVPAAPDVECGHVTGCCLPP